MKRSKSVARNSIQDYLALEPAEKVFQDSLLAKQKEEIRAWNTIVRDIHLARAKGEFMCQSTVREKERVKLEELGYYVYYPEDSTGYYAHIVWGTPELIEQVKKNFPSKSIN